MKSLKDNKKIPKKIDDVIDTILKIGFLLILLIGIYIIYDKIYVYSITDRNSIFYSLRAAAAEEEQTKKYELANSWLYISDTIEEPVMQGANNSEYLNKGPDGSYALRGSVFIDSRNAADYSDFYTLLYGHHMSYYQMFGALDHYFDEAYWTEEHTHGYILLSNDFNDENAEKLSFTVVAVGSIDASVGEIFNPTEVEDADIRNFLLNRKNFDISMITDEADLEGRRILCLSTCQTPDSTLRTCVICLFDE